MKLLLDTHIWLWSLLDPQRLSRRVIRELENKRNELWLSPISVWEVLILHQKRRIVLREDVEEWIAHALRVAPLTEAPVSYAVALETRAIQLPHNDPADRLLAAAAKVFGLTLVTADQHLLKAKGISTLANR
jgi:PIN domain nuclease of toxin-antitoxin system